MGSIILWLCLLNRIQQWGLISNIKLLIVFACLRYQISSALYILHVLFTILLDDKLVIFWLIFFRCVSFFSFIWLMCKHLWKNAKSWVSVKFLMFINTLICQIHFGIANRFNSVVLIFLIGIRTWQSNFILFLVIDHIK